MKPEPYVGIQGIEQSQPPAYEMGDFVTCSEPYHKTGADFKDCMACARPVCLTCVIKASHKSKGEAFPYRLQNLCSLCWSSGNSPDGSLGSALTGLATSYAAHVEALHICACSARDAWLCSRCKGKTSRGVELTSLQCAGKGCSTIMKAGEHAGRVCKWCGLPLQTRYTLAESRRRYDALHLHAREHSSYEPLAPSESVPEEVSAYRQTSARSKEGRATQEAWRDLLVSRPISLGYDDQRYQRRLPSDNETIGVPSHPLKMPVSRVGSYKKNSPSVLARANTDNDSDDDELDGITLTDVAIGTRNDEQRVLEKQVE